MLTHIGRCSRCDVNKALSREPSFVLALPRPQDSLELHLPPGRDFTRSGMVNESNLVDLNGIFVRETRVIVVR